MAVVLYDANNNKIDHLTQWDKKQTIVIKGLSVSAAPEFHIANASCREAIRVTSVLDNGALTVSIPDEILEDGLPFLMYAYQMDSSGSAQTIYTIGVPVHPRQKYGRNTGIKRTGKESILSPLGQTLRDRCGLLFAETGDQLRSHSPVFTSRDFLRSPVSWRTGLCVCRER